MHPDPEARSRSGGRLSLPPSLRWNVLSTLMGNGVYSAAQWSVTILLARLGTPEMIGQLALGLAITAPIFACTGFQLRSVQATDALNTYRFADFLGLRAVGTLLAMMGVSAVALFSPWARQTMLVVFIVGVRSAVESLSDVIYGYFQKQERLELIARAMIARAVTGLLVLVVALLVSGKLAVSLICMTLAWMGCLVFYESRILIRLSRESPLREMGFRWNPGVQKIRQLVVLSLPLTAVMFLLSSSQSIPRLFLQSYAGERELGFFSAVAVLSGGIGIVFMAIGQAILPRLAKLHIEDLTRYRRLLVWSLLIAGGMGLLLIAGAHLFGKALLAAVYGSAYLSFGNVLTGLVLAATINNICVLLGVGATASRSFIPQLFAALLTVVVAVATAAVFVPRFGLAGATYCVLLTGTAQLLAYGYLCLRVAGWERPPARLRENHA